MNVNYIIVVTLDTYSRSQLLGVSVLLDWLIHVEFLKMS